MATDRANGHPNPDGVLACTRCGAPIPPVPAPAAVSKSRSRTPWILTTALFVVLSLVAGSALMSAGSDLADTRDQLQTARSDMSDSKSKVHDLEGQLSSAQHQLGSAESDLTSAKSDLTTAEACMKGLAKFISSAGRNSFGGYVNAIAALKGVQSECKTAFGNAGSHYSNPL